MPAEPALVVATPGAEPVAQRTATPPRCCSTAGRCSAGPDLRAAEEALRRWLNAAALVRPRRRPWWCWPRRTCRRCRRWSAGTRPAYAERELAERAELGFPPAVRMASLTGPPDAVADFVGAAELPDVAEVLGPVPEGGPEGTGGRAAPPR